MFTPKYFAVWTDSNSWLCIKYLHITGFLDQVIWSTWYLLGLNSMSQIRSKHWRVSKLHWRTWLSCKLETVKNTALSSANNLTWDWIFSGRSFMYKRKRSGPSTDCWGMPEVTGTSFEDSPSSTTLVEQFECDLLKMTESTLMCFL